MRPSPGGRPGHRPTTAPPDGPPPPRQWRPLVLGLAAPAVLAAVALTQVVLTQTRDLTPWKGGGFGMFSSVDLESHRAVRAYLGTPDGEVPAVLTAPDGVSAVSEDTVVRARNLPTPASLDAVVAEVAGHEWVYEQRDGERVAVAREAEAAALGSTGDEAAQGGGAASDQLVGQLEVQVDSVRLEVWKLTFDDDRVAAVPTKLADVDREVRP